MRRDRSPEKVQHRSRTQSLPVTEDKSEKEISHLLVFPTRLSDPSNKYQLPGESRLRNIERDSLQAPMRQTGRVGLHSSTKKREGDTRKWGEVYLISILTLHRPAGRKVKK